MEIKNAISGLRRIGFDPMKKSTVYNFGDKEISRMLFNAAFMEVDETMENYMFLPEYEKVIDWMSDSKGKGLYLHGDCGRGKSTILYRVLPVLFYMKFNKILSVIHSSEIQSKIEEYINYSLIGIDEVGQEPIISNYGSRYEGFNRLIDRAEIKGNPIFITTNLTNEQMYERYGERTIDRISKLAISIEFSGKSMRV
jgi:DNA replication protein DnaC